jgi:hypothetical protein
VAMVPSTRNRPLAQGAPEGPLQASLPALQTPNHLLVFSSLLISLFAAATVWAALLSSLSRGLDLLNWPVIRTRDAIGAIAASYTVAQRRIANLEPVARREVPEPC